MHKYMHISHKGTSMVADERVYFTDSAARLLKMKNRERGAVQDDAVELDSVKSGGSVQLEFVSCDYVNS